MSKSGPERRIRWSEWSIGPYGTIAGAGCLAPVLAGLMAARVQTEPDPGVGVHLAETEQIEAPTGVTPGMGMGLVAGTHQIVTVHQVEPCRNGRIGEVRGRCATCVGAAHRA